LKRHLSNLITPGEREELASLVEQSGDEGLATELQQCWDGYEGKKTLTEQHTMTILATILQPGNRQEVLPVPAPVHRIHFLRRRWIRFTAAAIFILVAGTAVWRLYMNNKNTLVPQQPLAANSSKSYIRNLTLPDGSTVVLQAGSTLDYPAAFNGSTREVSLSGEAYFDIQHDTAKPFIIHTGSVSTTVLGTAFNIKAYAGQQNIVVSVTRGKVKVEDQHKLLAILTPDQQLDYQPAAATASEHKVDANTLVTDWTKQDMVFEESPFAVVAEVLRKRYDVTIHFDNDYLLQCPIHASFKGTETLQNVLNVVCKVLGAAWEMKDDKTIVISGKGCGS
jgi:ferric-dicitrate binding protein FerR (iron transport regulator)